MKAKKSKSLKKFKFGLKQIVIEVGTGILTNLGLALLANYGYLPDTVALIINAILIIANILLAKAMLSWGLFYTAGWLIGSFIFFKIGLLSGWDFVLYFVVPIVVLVGRVTLTIKKFVAI